MCNVGFGRGHWVRKVVVSILLLIALRQNSRDGRRESLPREAMIHYRKLLCRIYQWLQGSFLLLIIIIHAKHNVCSLFCCSEIKDLTQEIRVGNCLAPTKKDIKKGRNSSHSGRVVGKIQNALQSCWTWLQREASSYDK